MNPELRDRRSPGLQVSCARAAHAVARNCLQGAHGQEWRDGHLWTTSSSSRSILPAFFKYDIESGSIVEKVQLADSDRVAHGLTI